MMGNIYALDFRAAFYWTESLTSCKIIRRAPARKLFGGSKLANIKSQIKRNRQNDKRRLANRVFRGEARTAVRDARLAIEAGAPNSKEELLKAISTLDKAAEKGVIHKNNAARRKSRLMKAFARMEPVKVVAAEQGLVEPVAEAVETKKAASRKRTAAKVEPKAEAKAEKVSEAKAAPKKAAVSSPKGKKPAEKKAAVKKPAEKKPAAKKTTSKKPSEKK
jgi:small subunit ribosomal protein S20